MSKAKGAGGAVDQIVKLIVGAGQASPSPPVGPALGSKGVKSMDFCKVMRPDLDAASIETIADLKLSQIRSSTPEQRTSIPVHQCLVV